MDEIKFYKVNEQYGFFSNFSSYPIFINGEVWKTVEHYFQASKFDSIEIRNKIKSLDSPIKAAIEGRDTKKSIREDWEMVKDEIMLNALYAKFLQHPDLKRELLNTRDRLIIEDTTNDKYWGNGGNGSGKNKLGKLLMEVRRKVNSLSSDNSVVFPPWIAFPKVSQFDLFWRMGFGEEYLSQWSKYYLNLKDKEKEKYEKEFAPDSNWEGIYDE